MSQARHRGSTTRFAVKLLLLVVLICAGVYLLLLHDLNRTLKWRLSRLHAAGVPRTWAEVIPPPIPDRDNAAIIYAQAFKQLYLTSDDREALKSFLNTRQPVSRDALQAPVQLVLARNGAALGLAKQGGARPGCRWSVDWSDPPPLVLLTYLGEVRTCVRLLAADAIMAARERNAGRALESLRAAIVMSARATANPTLQPLLSGARDEVTALDALPRVLEEINLDAPACRGFAQELEGLDFRQDYPRAVAQEALVGLWCFDAVQRDRGTIKDILEYGVNANGPPASAVWLYLSPAAKLARLGEEITYVELMQEALHLAHEPYRQVAARYQRLDENMERARWYQLIIRNFAATNAEIGPTNEQTAILFERALALRNAMQVALALKAYRAERRAYPNSLDALREYLGGTSAAPEMRRSRIHGWKLPADPFSGKDFGYRRQGASFVLYGWGEDLRDDGGQPDRDMVWEFRR